MILKFPDVKREKILQLSQHELWSNSGKETLDYLRDTRKISDDVIKQFGVGYCPREADHDLAGRIIMPLFNSYNELIVLTTRDVKNKEFSHWHEVFDKSNYLYGLNVAKENIRRNDKAIVVEGQFDTMCFHSYGLSMTVGALGSTFSIVQLSLLSRYCSEIYFIFDPDEAGRAAKERTFEMYNQYCLFNYGIRFYSVDLPNEQDPDEFIIQYGVSGVFNVMKSSKERQIHG